MMDKFETCHAVTHRWERGYSNHPRDPGGATQDGVTQRVYDAWRRSNGLAPRPVRQSTPDERGQIFREQYWLPVRGEALPPGIDLAVYDFAVNSGVSRAIRYLQAALGVKMDGHLGEVTIRAALDAAETGNAVKVVQSIMAGREKFLRGLSTFDAFGNGWMNRLVDVGKEARRMASEKALKRTARKGADTDAYQPDAARDQPPQPSSAATTANQIIVATGAAGGAAAMAGDKTKELLGGMVPEWALLVLILAAMTGAALVALYQLRQAKEDV